VVTDPQTNKQTNKHPQTHTHTHTHTHTQRERQDRLYTAPQLASAQCNYDAKRDGS